MEPTHSEDVKVQFRAHYLYSGNASESAIAVGMPPRTGRDLAKRLLEDPEFAADRRALRENALEELVAMRMRVAQCALKRLEAEVSEPKEGEQPAVPWIDKRADYGKLVLEAEKNAHNLAKVSAQPGSEQPAKTEVHVHLSSPKAIDGGTDPSS